MQIIGLQSTLVGKANNALSLGFFPRFKKAFWPKIARSVPSTRLVEPFVLNGAAPLLRKWNGSMQSSGRGSWNLNVPNELYKSFEDVDRTDLEADQTGTVISGMFAVGIRGAETPDYLLANKILTGDSSASASVIFRGVTYYTTFENGTPIFSNTHIGAGGVANQSNIVQGNAPNSVATYAAQDMGTSAQGFIKDMQLVCARIMSWVDDKGALLYPQFDMSTDLTVVCTPLMAPAARLAFMTPGVIAGSGGTSGGSGSTTNIGPTMCKEVIANGLLAGCPDITVESQSASLAPAFVTQYYVIINNDYVAPFYYQRFTPPKAGDLVPAGMGIENEAVAIVKKGSEANVPIDQVAAEVFSEFEVNTNIGALGTQGQRDIAATEKFFVEGRMRLAFVYGPWFTIVKVDPTGQST